MAFSGSTEFNPTWCKRGIEVADWAAVGVEARQSNTEADAKMGRGAFIESLVRQEAFQGQ
jgi:hypothetical protein